jgi:hypothetical protein
LSTLNLQTSGSTLREFWMPSAYLNITKLYQSLPKSSFAFCSYHTSHLETCGAPSYEAVALRLGSSRLIVRCGIALVNQLSTYDSVVDLKLCKQSLTTSFLYCKNLPESQTSHPTYCSEVARQVLKLAPRPGHHQGVSSITDSYWDSIFLRSLSGHMY